MKNMTELSNDIAQLTLAKKQEIETLISAGKKLTAERKKLGLNYLNKLAMLVKEIEALEECSKNKSLEGSKEHQEVMHKNHIHMIYTEMDAIDYKGSCGFTKVEQETIDCAQAEIATYRLKLAREHLQTVDQLRTEKEAAKNVKAEGWNLARFLRKSNQSEQLSSSGGATSNSNESTIAEASKEKINYKTFILTTETLAEKNAFAMNNLGIFYYKGLGTERNFEKAVDCFQRAAAMGHKVAEFNLGFCYERGEGVEKDLKKAFAHFSRADSPDFHIVKLHLGLYYALGLGGVKQDPDKAKVFLDTAKLKRDSSILLKYSNINNTILWCEDKDHNVSEKLVDESQASYSLVDLRYLAIFTSPSSNSNTFIDSYNKLDPLYKAAFEGDLEYFSARLSIWRKSLEKADLKGYMEKHSLNTKSKAIDHYIIYNTDKNGALLIMAVLGNSREIIKQLYKLGCDPSIGFYKDPNVGPLSSIHLATLSGNNVTLNTLLSNNFISEMLDLNSGLLRKDVDYELTPLICAVLGGDDGECAKILLSLGADINETNKKGHTALMEAMLSQNHEMVQFLCENGADLSQRTLTGSAESALTFGCKQDNVTGVEIMTSFEHCTFPLSQVGYNMVSPLGIAIERNNMNMIVTIVNSKAFRAKPDLNARYERRPTLLKDTPLKGFDKKKLGALPLASVLSQVNALQYAVELGRTEIVKLLMTSVPNNLPEALRPIFTKDCLTIAIEKGNEEIIKLFLEKKVFNINEVDEIGRTYLHKLIDALPNGAKEIADIFLGYKIDYTRKDDRGLTPLMLCFKKAAEIEALKNMEINEDFEEFCQQLINQGKKLDDPLLYDIMILRMIASSIILTMMFNYLDALLEIKKIKLENFDSEKSFHMIGFIGNKLRNYLKLSNSDGQIYLIVPTHKFDDAVLPRSLKRMLPRYIKITDNIFKRIVTDIFEKVQDEYSEKITTQVLFEIIWNCCDEKLVFDKQGLEKKVKEEQQALKTAIEAIDCDLIWMPDRVRKYLDESLKLTQNRENVKTIFENIKVLLKDSMIAADYGAAKLQTAQELLAEISGLSEKLLQQQVSFTCAYQKIQPKIKACFTNKDLKQAKQLMGHLNKIKAKIENLGEQFKQVFKRLSDLEETLTEKLSYERARQILLQKRQEEKASKEKSYLQQCVERLENAEQRLEELREKVETRAQTEKDKRREYQSRLAKQKQQKAESLLFQESALMLAENSILQKEMKQAKEREADKMLAFANKTSKNRQVMEHGFAGHTSYKYAEYEYRRKPARGVNLGHYLVQPQLKLKAREELSKLAELLQSFAFADDKAFAAAKMQRFAIMGIVARAMECYKNIRVHKPGINDIQTKDDAQVKKLNSNIFKEYARIFRNAAFHCLDEKLFKKIGDDAKKNAEVNQAFIDMACKMLSFLNDPKWQKQAITKEDIMQAFAGKSKGNDLFTKIIKLTIKSPSAEECKNQILQGRRDLKEFEALQDKVTNLFYQAAIGFCYARIGCFAADLIKHKGSTPADKVYRAVFNELRREYNIPLGKYIQLGVGFRHVLISKPILLEEQPELLEEEALEVTVKRDISREEVMDIIDISELQLKAKVIRI